MNANAIDEFSTEPGPCCRVQRGPAAAASCDAHRTEVGKSYTTPIVHMKAGDRYVIIGSMGGSPVNPQRFHNIVANPIVVLEAADERLTARARVAEGAERDELFAMMAAVAPEFESYPIARRGSSRLSSSNGSTLHRIWQRRNELADAADVSETQTFHIGVGARILHQTVHGPPQRSTRASELEGRAEAISDPRGLPRG